MLLKDLKNSIKIINNIILKFPKLSCLVSGLLLKNSFNRLEQFAWVVISFTILIKLLNNCLNINESKAPFNIGFIFGFGYFLSTLYWISESSKCVGMSNLGYIAVLFLVLYLSVYPAFVCYCSVRFATDKFNLVLYFSIFWTISEYLRGTLLTGFPWNLLGYSIYKVPYFSQIADIFGIYGVSFLIILIVSLCSNKKYIVHGVVLFTSIIVYGYYKVEIYSGYTIPIKQNDIILIQPSIPQEKKLNHEFFWENIELQIKLSNIKNKYFNNKKLIIWPEAAVNIPINTNLFLVNYLSNQLTDNNTLLITGADRQENSKNYNSVVIINNKHSIIRYYDKRHLVPGGEFISEWLLNLGLKNLTAGMSNFSTGVVSNTIRLEGYSPFDVVICYEIIFPHHIMDSPNASEWILNISNDAWFKQTDGPYQHIKAACFRAIEQGRAIARCANNGISCIINCNGKILQKLNTDTVGIIHYKMPLKYQSTIYSKYGNITILFILSVFFILLTYIVHIRPKLHS